MNAEWEYQTDKVALVPYSKELKGFPEEILGILYMQTKHDGLLDVSFCGMPPMTFNAFVFYMSTHPMQIYCSKDEEGMLTPQGYCWITDTNGVDGCRMGMFGFSFFRRFWGKQETRDLVYLCLAYWFRTLKIDILYGITKELNLLARNFSRRFGFVEIATAPGFLYSRDYREDATIVMLKKEDFIPIFDAWHKRKLEAMKREA